MTIEADSYAKHKNLKIAATELGIPWQTLYVKLRRQGVAVTGDKARYGGPSDQLAVKAEALFKFLVPNAVSKNDEQWQAKFDFLVGGRNRVDVKASKRNKQSKRSKALRWSFLFSKQSYECDFFCCFCLTEDGEAVEKILLIPHEIAQGLQTMSVPCASRGKWGDYEIASGELADFFASI